MSSNTDSNSLGLVDHEILEHLEEELSRLGEPILTDTAVLMGDPGCKGVLTLHNLVAEEEAALELKLNREVTLSDLTKPNPITYPWRHFSCAGDDHTAIGPSSYLDNIGRSHEKNQMVLSEGKHVRSMIGGFYCERVIFRGPDTILTSPGWSYDHHALVDSVKVRLLSPETKDREAEVETNPAIGKARLLFKQLTWSPPGWQRTLNVLVQRRFFGRMRKHLPKQPNGDISRMVELPNCLGGLSMCPPSFAEWDVENVLAELSDAHLRILNHLLKGRELDALARRALARYSSDRYARGIPLDDATDLVIDRLYDLQWTKEESEVLAEARKRFKLRDNLGYRHVLKHVTKLGYETRFTLKRKLARSYNQACLLVDAPNRGFKTATWERREIAFQADLLICNVTNEVESEYDLKFIYDKLKSFKHQEQLYRAIREKEQYLDPTYEIDTDNGRTSILKDLSQDLPSTKLPPMEVFL